MMSLNKSLNTGSKLWIIQLYQGKFTSIMQSYLQGLIKAFLFPIQSILVSMLYSFQQFMVKLPLQTQPLFIYSHVHLCTHHLLPIGNTWFFVALPNGITLTIQNSNQLILKDFFSGTWFALIVRKRNVLRCRKYLDTEEVKHGN